MDYGKYKFEAQQRAKESRKKATNVTVKEMKYRPKIGVGDFDTKTRKVEGFLAEGHKVKVTIMFRGREMQHPELGRKILDRIAEGVIDVGKVEIMPKQDGRNMTMVLGPDKKAQQTAKKAEAAVDKATDQPTNGASAPSPVTAPSEVAATVAPTPPEPAPLESAAPEAAAANEAPSPVLEDPEASAAT